MSSPPPSGIPVSAPVFHPSKFRPPPPHLDGWLRASLHDKPHGRYSQYGLRFPYVKYWNLSPVATGSRRTCTDQLTGIHLSSSESFLSGDTWNDMVKHQICTRVDDWPSAINCTRSSSPSMHLSDPGGVRNSVSQRWRPV